MHKACLENGVNEVNRLNWNMRLAGACEDGHLDIINLMIEKGATNWDWGLRGACQGGHLNIVNLMIEKGADNWNWALRGACRGGHLDIAKLMIQKGANNWNWALRGAYENGHLEILNLMIEKGANDWNLIIKYPFDTQLKMFKNIDFYNKCKMINQSFILFNGLKFYTLINLDLLNIPKDLFYIISKFMVSANS